MRDGALSMMAFMEINENDYDEIKTEMYAYEQWVSEVQNVTDPNQ